MNSEQFIFAAVRAIHFLASMLAASVWVFDRLVLPAGGSIGQSTRWAITARRVAIAALLISAMAGVAWFVIVAMNMSGLPLRDIHRDVLDLVWTQTTFGHVWQVRSITWGVAFAASLLTIGRIRGAAVWIASIAAISFLASLAWCGHGLIGNTPGLHLGIDALHLLILAAWPGGLFPLAIVFLRARRTGRWEQLAAMVKRFSVVSIIAVALLVSSGIGNTVFLLDTPLDMLRWPYGVLLSCKIGLTLLILIVAAANLLYFRPRLETPSPHGAARAMQKTIAIEMLLVIAVILIVGLLGLLPPHG